MPSMIPILKDDRLACRAADGAMFSHHGWSRVMWPKLSSGHAQTSLVFMTPEPARRSGTSLCDHARLVASRWSVSSAASKRDPELPCGPPIFFFHGMNSRVSFRTEPISLARPSVPRWVIRTVVTRPEGRYIPRCASLVYHLTPIRSTQLPPFRPGHPGHTPNPPNRVLCQSAPSIAMEVTSPRGRSQIGIREYRSGYTTSYAAVGSVEGEEHMASFVASESSYHAEGSHVLPW